MDNDTFERALVCHEILVEMEENRQACSLGHPLYKAMRDLQRTYSGVFPEDLRDLWNDVCKPIHPNAVIQYHLGVDRLREWFSSQFFIKKGIINELGDDEIPTNTGKVDEQHSAVDWLAEMEKGSGSNEEFDIGDSSNILSTERNSKDTRDPDEI